MSIAIDAAKAVRQRFGEKVAEPIVFTDKVTGRDEVTVSVPRDNIAVICQFLKNDAALAFDYLVDITGVDHGDRDPRFQVDYLLYSFKNGCLLRLRIVVPEADATAPSVTGVWKGADWHEREVFDMLGIRFNGHPDLRRILMWEGYPYFPLRKDFPLAGKPSEAPGVAFSEAAPLEGGPFVTGPAPHAFGREPRAKSVTSRSDR
jgi:NADH-quinone oxidoreductase subunit C